jgi:hypothetical protein
VSTFRELMRELIASHHYRRSAHIDCHHAYRGKIGSVAISLGGQCVPMVHVPKDTERKPQQSFVW